MFLNKKRAILVISISSLVFFLIFDQVKAQDLRVVDGDTIHLNGEKIRFTGIDTPELKQTCINNGVKDPCGVTAKEILIEKIGNNKVECNSEGKDRYKRTVFESPTIWIIFYGCCRCHIIFWCRVFCVSIYR